jgi:hypothetical protein
MTDNLLSRLDEASVGLGLSPTNGLAQEAAKEIRRLRRYEQAVAEMAKQFCSPTFTAEELVAQCLGEPLPKSKHKRATR